MCTLTWHREGERYEVHFNRDESRARPAGLPPRLGELRGVPFVAPLDGEAGGTWLLANAHGQTLALLNGYRWMRDPRGGRPAGAVSRGLLVLSLADCPDADEVARRLAAEDLARFQPFSLHVFQSSSAPGRSVRAFHWDGHGLRATAVTDGDRPVCSSSFDQAGAEVQRTLVLERDLATSADPVPAVLARFHRSHEPERGAHSPCMHRADAATVSYTRVAVTPAGVELEYAPAAPCRGAPTVRAALPRLAPAGVGGSR